MLFIALSQFKLKKRKNCFLKKKFTFFKMLSLDIVCHYFVFILMLCQDMSHLHRNAAKQNFCNKIGTKNSRII